MRGNLERTKKFLTIPKAAELAGVSERHFRRIINEENMPIVHIGHKYFILGRDFDRWKAANGVRR